MLSGFTHLILTPAYVLLLPHFSLTGTKAQCGEVICVLEVRQLASFRLELVPREADSDVCVLKLSLRLLTSLREDEVT